MQSRFINRVRGYVKVSVTGKRLEFMLNQIVLNGLYVWDISRHDKRQVDFYIILRDFFRLRPYLKQTGCRVHVCKRYGFPFFLDKLEKRKFFTAGIFLFVAGLYLLSSIVWHVQVEGNEKLAAGTILEAAEQQGIYPFQWKFRMKDSAALSRELLGMLPGTAWVGVEVNGTTVTIKVVESTIPDPKPLMSPRHLVASRSAEVTQILAEKGKPMVKPHSIVKKGDILISGMIGDEQNSQTVVAQGIVKGNVWEKANVQTPLTQQIKVYTGDQKKRHYIVLGNRALMVWGYGKISFERFENVHDRKSLQWRDVVLPIGWLNETLMSVQIHETTYTPEEAAIFALNQARAEVLTYSGKDAKLLQEKILQTKTENGQLTIDVLFEVEQHITEELPIVEQPVAPAQ